MLALLVLSVTACRTNEPNGSSNQTVAESRTMHGSTATPTTTTVAVPSDDDEIRRIIVTVGVDSGPDRVEEVSVGESVELTIVNPDDDDEFHVHGFDLGGEETPAGEEKVFAFTATEAGDFEVESHVSGEVLVVIRVS